MTANIMRSMADDILLFMCFQTCKSKGRHACMTCDSCVDVQSHALTWVQCTSSYVRDVLYWIYHKHSWMYGFVPLATTCQSYKYGKKDCKLQGNAQQCVWEFVVFVGSYWFPGCQHNNGHVSYLMGDIQDYMWISIGFTGWYKSSKAGAQKMPRIISEN